MRSNRRGNRTRAIHIGLEITRPVAAKGAPTLLSVDRGGSASYLVLDRSWVHGTVQDETSGGFNLSGTNNAAVVDSYFSDLHCTSRTGSCSEAHAVSGGAGNYQDGPYKIEDNFLEASGQAVLFGGVGHLGQRGLGGRVDHGEAATAAAGPLTADQQARGDVDTGQGGEFTAHGPRLSPRYAGAVRRRAAAARSNDSP